MTLVLRSMEVEDIPAVVVIERQVQLHPWSHQLFADSVNGSDICWVLTEGSQVVGYAVLKAILDEAELLTLSIKPEYQGKGLGRYLLEGVIQRIQAGGVSQLFLEVRISNAVAIGLYLSCGFAHIGRRSGYYPTDSGGREDAFVLSASLVNS